LIFATASLLGLHGVLLAVPSLYLLLKVGGLFMGFPCLEEARHPLVAEIQHHDRSNVPSTISNGELTAQ
jgi:threonine/homoserine/homoserine lactone efflux protein